MLFSISPEAIISTKLSPVNKSKLSWVLTAIIPPSSSYNTSSEPVTLIFFSLTNFCLISLIISITCLLSKSVKLELLYSSLSTISFTIFWDSNKLPKDILLSVIFNPYFLTILGDIAVLSIPNIDIIENTEIVWLLIPVLPIICSFSLSVAVFCNSSNTSEILLELSKVLNLPNIPSISPTPAILNLKGTWVSKSESNSINLKSPVLPYCWNNEDIVKKLE